MDIQEEMKINAYQPTYGTEGTDIGNIYNAIIKDCKALGWNPANSIPYLMDQAYSLGLMHGKRKERARRKQRK